MNLIIEGEINQKKMRDSYDHYGVIVLRKFLNDDTLVKLEDFIKFTVRKRLTECFKWPGEPIKDNFIILSPSK